MILTFRFSTYTGQRGVEGGKGCCAPAVNSVPASSAVFRKASRSFSWVMDFSFEVESKSVVYYKVSVRLIMEGGGVQLPGQFPACVWHLWPSC